MDDCCVKVNNLAESYLRNWDEGNKGVRQVYEWWRGDRSSYLGRCYSTFYLKGTTVFINFKEFLKCHSDLPKDELTSALWEEYLYNAQRLRRTRKGGVSSLENLFITEFMEVHGYRGERHRRTTRKLFYGYLTTQCVGMVAEYETYRALKERLANSSVRLAGSSDESKDVDAYIDDIPVSIKAFKAFSKSTITRYRRKSSKPVIYINQDLHHYVIGPGGKLQWRSADRLETTVDALSGVSQMPLARC